MSSQDIETAIELRGKHRPRTTYHLGNLNKMLRDLQGFTTLVYELIQNADDVPDTTYIVFNITDDALIVDNDGFFSDCGNIDAPECLWKNDPEKNHYCDFHRFQIVANADKRNQEGTSGAFGIGFTAVYQITDHPELISQGRHWILSEDKREDYRIWECPGCPRCQTPDLPGTRFILPWAFDPNTPLRKALDSSPIIPSNLNEFQRELENTLPTAMLFLKRLERAELRKSGVSLKLIQRVLYDDDLLISDGSQDYTWHLINGNLDEEAAKLRLEYGEKIERKRHNNIKIAIPYDSDVNGVLCALMPTKTTTGFPFHINADFYPSSDRKNIAFEKDYQAAWNRAALKAAANALSEQFAQLPGLIRADRIWRMISSIYRVYREAEEGEREHTLRNFWLQIARNINNMPIMFTSKGEWKRPCETFLLGREEEEEALPVLESLNLDIIHATVRPYIFGLPRQEVFGIKLLDFSSIIGQLKKLGLTKHIKTFPEALSSSRDRKTLWEELERLFDRNGRPTLQSETIEELSEIAFAPGIDGTLWPFREIYRANKLTIALFSTIIPSIPFLDDRFERKNLRTLCPEFTVERAIEWLTTLTKENIQEMERKGRSDIEQLC